MKGWLRIWDTKWVPIKDIISIDRSKSGTYDVVTIHGGISLGVDPKYNYGIEELVMGPQTASAAKEFTCIFCGGKYWDEAKHECKKPVVDVAKAYQKGYDAGCKVGAAYVEPAPRQVLAEKVLHEICRYYAPGVDVDSSYENVAAWLDDLVDEMKESKRFKDSILVPTLAAIAKILEEAK